MIPVLFTLLEARISHRYNNVWKGTANYLTMVDHLTEYHSPKQVLRENSHGEVI
jgi:hypothetical protein